MPHLIYRGGSRGKPKVTRWKAACETHSVYWLQIEKGMELGAEIRKEPGDATIAARGEHCLASACPNVKSGSGAGGGRGLKHPPQPRASISPCCSTHGPHQELGHSRERGGRITQLLTASDKEKTSAHTSDKSLISVSQGGFLPPPTRRGYLRCS